MEHFFEVCIELLFGLVKNKPDKMPDNTSCEPRFCVKYSTTVMVILVSIILIIITVFSLIMIIVDADTQALFLVFIIVLSCALFFTLVSFSFRYLFTEEYIQKSHFGLCRKHIEWCRVSCIRVVEQTDAKNVIIAIYDEEGKCFIDIDSDMDNAWNVVKMAEVKNIVIKHEKDLSLKQLSHL